MEQANAIGKGRLLDSGVQDLQPNVQKELIMGEVLMQQSVQYTLVRPG